MTSTGATSDGGDGAPDHTVVWGTDINVQQAKRKFTEFLENFVEDLAEARDGVSSELDSITPFYMDRLEEVSTFY